jgi:prophage DNA circulation protein
MPGVVHNLEPLTFDGLEPVPVISIETSGGHRQAERVYPYVDAAAHEWTGREPYRVRGRLALVNTAKQNLFPGVWAALRKRFQDGTSGELRHPDIGVFQAALTSFSWALDGRTPHGIIVDVEFVETIADPDTPTEFEFNTGGSAEIAEQADNAMAAMGLSYPSGMGSLAQSVAAIASLPADLIGEVSAKIDATIGQIDQIQASIYSVVEAANALDDAARDAVQCSVDRITLERLLADLRWSLKQDKASLEKAARPVKTFVADADSTLATISFRLGANLAGLIQLNPSLLAVPLVPKGAAVKYFA